MSIFDASVIRYGDIEIAPGALIGPHVVLGHPAAIDVLRALPDASESEGLAAFFARLAGNPTRIGSRIRAGTVRGEISAQPAKRRIIRSRRARRPWRS